MRQSNSTVVAESIKNAILALLKGKAILLVDNQNQEDEKDNIDVGELIFTKNVKNILRNNLEMVSTTISEMSSDQLELCGQIDNHTFSTPPSYITVQLPGLIDFGTKTNLKIITIKDFINYQLKTNNIVEKGVQAKLPTKYGSFNIIPFQQKGNGLEHIALIKGEIIPDKPILVRMHSSCATGDIFESLRCECGEQLRKSMEIIEAEGCGVIIYLNQEGRGIGLMEKIKAYKLQDQGMDTVDANICLGHKADERDYGVGAQMLKSIGVTKVRLMTNNPSKCVGLENHGIIVVENVPIEVRPNKYNERYMRTKKERMGHILHYID